MNPALARILGPLLLLGLIGYGLVFLAEWLNGQIPDGPLSMLAVLAGGGLAVALWLARLAWLLWPGWRWKWRAWFYLVAWGYGLGLAGWEHWQRWREAGEFGQLDAGMSIAVAIVSALVFLLGMTHGKARAAGDALVERGARLIDADAAQRAIWGRKHEPDDALIRLGGLDVPPGVETKHFMLCGSTGSGKTQAIQRILDAVRARRGRVLAADSGGEFFSRYAVPGDLLLNPFDWRSAPWSPFAEIEADYDCQRIAASAIPDREGAGGEWNRYAQSLLAEVLLALHKRGDHSTRELLRCLTAADADELAGLLAGTPGAAVVGSGNDRMLASVRSIIATYLGAWRYLPDAGEFSIRRWIRDEDSPAWLFATYRDDQLALLRHLIATWLDLALVEALTLSEDESRQLWFVFDECDSLGKVGELAQALAKLRKHGGRCVLGCQTVAQLRDTYGANTAQTLAANAASKLILRAGDNETARYFSAELGDQDIARVAVSSGQSSQDGRLAGSSSQSTSVQRTRRAAVLPAELMRLPDLEGFLCLAGVPAAIRLKLEYRSVPQHVPAYLPLADRPAEDPATPPPGDLDVDAGEIEPGGGLVDQT